MSNKTTIVKHAFSYTISRYIAQVLNFFTSIFIKRFLGPVNVGIWNLLKVFIDYSNYTDLGAPDVAFYQIPYLKGMGKFGEAQTLKNNIFNFVLLSSAISSMAVLIYALFSWGNIRPEFAFGLFVISALFFAQKIYAYNIVLMRANKDFGLLSAVAIFDSVMNLVLILTIVRPFQLYGFYAVILILPVLNILFVRSRVDYGLEPGFRFKGLLANIKFGLPLYFTNILRCVLNSVDKILIASMLGFEQLGFYSIALMTKGYGADISLNFSHVVAPYFFESCGKNGDLERSSAYVVKTTMIVCYFMSALMALVFIWAPIFIFYVLPKFIPGILAMKIFLLTTVFSSISYYSVDYLVMLKKQIRMVPVIAVLILASLSANYFAIKCGFGISGVAATVALVSFLYFYACFFYAVKVSGNAGSMAGLTVKILFPVIYTAGILLLLERFLDLGNVFLSASAYSAVFAILFLPMLFIVNRETGVIDIIIKVILNRKEPVS